MVCVISGRKEREKEREKGVGERRCTSRDEIGKKRGREERKDGEIIMKVKKGTREKEREESDDNEGRGIRGGERWREKGKEKGRTTIERRKREAVKE